MGTNSVSKNAPPEDLGDDAFSVTFITIEEIDLIFKEISTFKVDVSTGVGFNPHILVDKATEVRNYVNRLVYHITEMNHRKLKLSRALNAFRTIYRMRGNELLVNDAAIRSLKSIKDREAAISVTLSEMSHKISVLEAQASELDTILASLALVHRELRDTASDIRNQTKLIELELRTKSYFGDEFEKRDRSKKSLEDEDDGDILFKKEVGDFLAEEGL